MKKYALDTNFSLLNSSQANEWLSKFLEIAEIAFKDSNNNIRLLGNLLVLERYVNTLRQGLAAKGKHLSAGLQHSIDLLWEYLEGYLTPTDFQDFANDFYTCLLAFNVGTTQDAPKEFYELYFRDTNCEAYELLAIEWSSGLLMQLVSIAGGRLDYEEFENYEKIDFYGIDIMFHILEDGYIETTNTLCSLKEREQICQTPLFRQIIVYAQDDLQKALNAVPNQFLSLRNKYQKYMFVPEGYETNLRESSYLKE